MAFCVLGGGLGASLRWLVAAYVPHHWGTMTVNVAGAFLIVFVVRLRCRGTMLKPELKLFLMTGLLGGFTTFSTYLLDFAVLCEKSDFGQAAVYLSLSVIVGLAFCSREFVSVTLSAAFNRR